jgi:hypothetical protein
LACSAVVAVLSSFRTDAVRLSLPDLLPIAPIEDGWIYRKEEPDVWRRWEARRWMGVSGSEGGGRGGCEFGR